MHISALQCWCREAYWRSHHNPSEVSFLNREFQMKFPCVLVLKELCTIGIGTGVGSNIVPGVRRPVSRTLSSGPPRETPRIRIVTYGGNKSLRGRGLIRPCG